MIHDDEDDDDDREEMTDEESEDESKSSFPCSFNSIQCNSISSAYLFHSIQSGQPRKTPKKLYSIDSFLRKSLMLNN